MFNRETMEDISKYSDKEQDKMIYTNILEQKILNFDDYFIDEEENIFGSENKKNKGRKPPVLSFRNKKENKGGYSPLQFKKTPQKIVETDLIKSIKYARRIPKLPTKILDAPGIIDDYYMNILDWSSDDVIGISLLNSIYLWKNTSKKDNVTRLIELDDSCYCSIKFSPDGKTLAAGDDAGYLHVYDVKSKQRTHEISVV